MDCTADYIPILGISYLLGMQCNAMDIGKKGVAFGANCPPPSQRNSDKKWRRPKKTLSESDMSQRMRMKLTLARAPLFIGQAHRLPIRRISSLRIYFRISSGSESSSSSANLYSISHSFVRSFVSSRVESDNWEQPKV